MKGMVFALLLIAQPFVLRADVEDRNEVLTCSFEAHTTMGAIAGKCTTQTLPDTVGFNVRWILTLIPDEQSVSRARLLQVDRFCDTVRSQTLIEGTFTLILPLWGDLVVKPDDPEYIDLAKSTSPLYETRPQEITVSQTSTAPLTLELRFEERTADFDIVLRKPSREWLIRYLDAFYRLGTNRPDGFSR